MKGDSRDLNPRLIEVLPTSFPEVKLFVPAVFADERGRLEEAYSQQNYNQFGLEEVFVQDLVTWSKRHVVRGPHWDDRMAKFVQVLKGRIFDVVVDMRAGSPTFKKWEGFDLSDANRRQLFVPKGFAHGFLTLASENIVHYKMSAQHDLAHERRIHWRDPSIAIAWPDVGPVHISDKDDSPSEYSGNP